MTELSSVGQLGPARHSLVPTTTSPAFTSVVRHVVIAGRGPYVNVRNPAKSAWMRLLFWAATAMPAIVVLGLATPAGAISFGQPDNGQHPNVVSLRFIRPNFDASLSCTGTLIAKDKKKYVFLTAAHCAQAELGGWNAQPAGSGSVGVSFDEVNPPNDTDPTDGGADGVNFVNQGVAIPSPLYHFPGSAGNNDQFDQALVVVPLSATNSFGETIAKRWSSVPGALSPATNLADIGEVDRIVTSYANPGQDLTFTAVGYGTQSDKSPQASGDGNMIKQDPNATFLNRNRVTVGFKNLNGLMINVMVNAAQGFGYTCPGDSGSPAIYTDPSGHERILGVLTAGNCRSFGAYSRIDFQETSDFIHCAYAVGDVAAVRDCVTRRFG